MQGNSWWAHSIQEIGKDNHHGICLNQSLFDGRIIMSHDKYFVLIDINSLLQKVLEAAVITLAGTQLLYLLSIGANVFSRDNVSQLPNHSTVA